MNKKRPLAVADAIAAHQLIGLGLRGSDPILFAPDQKHYVFVLQRGDLVRNGSWIDLCFGTSTSLEAPTKPTIVKLFTRSTEPLSDLVKGLRWLEDRRISFLWDDGREVPQVVVVDPLTQQLRKLTHHRSPIVAYDISKNGRTLVYTAETPRDKSAPRRMRRTGFAVTRESIWTLLDDSGYGLLASDQYETFVQDMSSGSSHRLVERHQKWSFPPHILTLSPDGRYAITTRPVPAAPPEWDSYTNDIFRNFHLPPARRHPEEANWLQQLNIIDIRRHDIRPLWNAPAFGAIRVIWSPDSRHIVVGPTFLPVKRADTEGLAGRSVTIVDILTADFQQLPVGQSSLTYGYAPLRWSKNDVIELGDPSEKSKNDKAFLRFIAGVWSRIDESKEEQPPPIQIEVKQDASTPPLIVAVDRNSGEQRRILEVDAELRTRFTLGKVEVVHWTASDGKPWTGLLYYPVHYQEGKRFPLVIQTHGYASGEFSLSGAGNLTTAFAAQPLANLDIAVLQIGGPDVEEADSLATPREVEISVAGYEGAIQHFTGIGLADRNKIGLVGFSRTCWHVTFALTHSSMPIAAAVIADGIDGSYVQYALSDSVGRTELEKDTGAAPFGKGLPVWIRNAPGFNADKINTPLRIELDSGPISGLLDFWELFSNLRYLHKPVELYVIPDIEHGAHVLQNPAQRLASQGGTVDWLRFWLKGEEDLDPAKADQYARWHEMRKLQEKNEKKPAGEVAPH